MIDLNFIDRKIFSQCFPGLSFSVPPPPPFPKLLCFREHGLLARITSRCCRSGCSSLLEIAPLFLHECTVELLHWFLHRQWVSEWVKWVFLYSELRLLGRRNPPTWIVYYTLFCLQSVSCRKVYQLLIILLPKSSKIDLKFLKFKKKILASFLFFWSFGLKQLFPIVFWLLQNSHWGFGSEDLVHGFGRSILFKEHHLSLLQRVTNLLWASATSTYSNQIKNDPVLCASRRRRITKEGEEDGCWEEGPIILFQEGGGMELRSAARNPIVLDFVLHALLAIKLRLCSRYEERNIPNLPIISTPLDAAIFFSDCVHNWAQFLQLVWTKS